MWIGVHQINGILMLAQDDLKVNIVTLSEHAVNSVAAGLIKSPLVLINKPKFSVHIIYLSFLYLLCIFLVYIQYYYFTLN